MNQHQYQYYVVLRVLMEEANMDCENATPNDPRWPGEWHDCRDLNPKGIKQWFDGTNDGWCPSCHVRHALGIPRDFQDQKSSRRKRNY